QAGDYSYRLFLSRRSPCKFKTTPRRHCMFKCGISIALILMLSGTALAQDKQPETPAAKPAAKPETKTEKTDKKSETLKVGDKAPAFSVEKWVKGDSITGFEKGKVFVVEFWATWCGPCIAQFPHLSELQSEYKGKGLTVIGTNIWEDAHGDAYDDKTFDTVKKFVGEQGDRMSYNVAYDGAT